MQSERPAFLRPAGSAVIDREDDGRLGAGWQTNARSVK
jgi:hypothetical protein